MHGIWKCSPYQQMAIFIHCCQGWRQKWINFLGYFLGHGESLLTRCYQALVETVYWLHEHENAACSVQTPNSTWLSYDNVMEVKELLHRFDTRSRLLLGALLLGSAGESKALKVFNRQRTADTDFSLRNLLERLCQGEPCLDKDSQALTTWVSNCDRFKVRLNFSSLLKCAFPQFPHFLARVC